MDCIAKSYRSQMYQRPVKYFTLTALSAADGHHTRTRARAHVYAYAPAKAFLSRQRYSHNVMHACRQAAPFLASQRFRMYVFGRV